jgi:hypothetical protein
MQPLNKPLSAFLALTTFALALPSAQAALNYSPDDLFLGFRQTGNTTRDYVINIGQASAFRDASTPFTLSLNLVAFNNEMTAAFGASWKTSGDISWGVVGTTQNTATGSDPIRLLYISEPLGTTPTASSSQSGPANAIIAFKNNWQTTGTETSISNSATEDPTQPSSWAGSISAAPPFGSNSLSPIEDTLGNGLELFRIPQTTTGQPVTDEGRFNINLTTGAITFTPQAVPEPTTTALFCVALGSCAGLRRLRRRRTTVL